MNLFTSILLPILTAIIGSVVGVLVQKLISSDKDNTYSDINIDSASKLTMLNYNESKRSIIYRLPKNGLFCYN